jgi:chromosomal replication initiator protein
MSRTTFLGVEALIAVVADFYGLHPRALKSRLRSQTVVNARHVAIYLVRTRLGNSYPEIGRVFGRDHSTVLMAVRKIESWAKLGQEPRLFEDIKAIELRLEAPCRAA